MKKILALTLALMLVLSLGTAFATGDDAAAAPVDTSGWTSAEAKLDDILTKNYAITTGDYPHETLKFVSTPDSSNPDATNLTIEDLAVSAVSGNKLVIDVPSYSKAGVYKYTISETAGDTQGVTYTESTVGIAVLVEYDYENKCLKVAKIGATKPEGSDDKADVFENTYKLGGDNDGSESLRVQKHVTGNLGDKSKYFTMTVTLTSEEGKFVRSDITVSGGSDAGNGQTIAAGEDGWTGTKTVTIKLKDGETVQFDNIPEGVTYKVEESTEYSDDTDKNGENGYDAPAYESEAGDIENGSKPTAEVTNNKENDIDTGIALDTLPYALVLALVVAGVVAMMLRRRKAKED